VNISSIVWWVDISRSPRFNTEHLRTSPNSRIESHFMLYNRIMTLYQTYQLEMDIYIYI